MQNPVCWQAKFLKLARFLLLDGKISRKIDNRGNKGSGFYMIRMTDRAIKAIQSLAEERAEEGQRMRLSIKSGGCSGMEYAMEFAHKEESDDAYEQDGLSYLVDRKSMKLLDGCEIDFDDGLSGKGFEIRNPNAESTCGCGRSFA
jgi:iron-sulfur cluster assembly protein/iron-sulfur cluster insertion protein